jgi:hypothetical protein
VDFELAQRPVCGECARCTAGTAGSE